MKFTSLCTLPKSGKFSCIVKKWHTQEKVLCRYSTLVQARIKIKDILAFFSNYLDANSKCGVESYSNDIFS
jgi:hypothetical protein